MAYLVKTHFKTNLDYNDPTYKQIKKDLNEVYFDTAQKAIDYSKWIFKHPNAIYTCAETVAQNTQEGSQKIFEKQTLWFWVNCQYIGLKYKVEQKFQEISKQLGVIN